MRDLQKDSLSQCSLPGKAWTFCSATEHVSYLHDLGVDIVGLANNHVYDFGPEAFLDTLTTLENAGIPYVGASRAEFLWAFFTPEATADSPGILLCYDNTLFCDAIREAKEHADFVIALPHWGLEHTTELEGEQVDGAHAYIDAGADAVIGAHPHILQGLEYYQGKPVLYSLGNFWFDDYDIDTAVAELRISGTREDGAETDLSGAEVELILHPGTQSNVYTALADTQEWRDRIFRHLEEISPHFTLPAAPLPRGISRSFSR